MGGYMLDCAKVMPSCAIGDGSSVQFSAVYTVDPWGGVGALGACSVVLAEVFVNMKLC